MHGRPAWREDAARSIELRIIAPPPVPSRRQAGPREARATPPVPPTVPQRQATVQTPELTAIAMPAAPAVPASAASTPHLNLQLPHAVVAAPGMLEQIHADPRSHSAPVTLEHRIADAAGTLPVEVVDSTDGSGGKLIRQGSKCTRVTPARIGTLNPMDSRATSLPSVSGPCYH